MTFRCYEQYIVPADGRHINYKKLKTLVKQVHQHAGIQPLVRTESRTYASFPRKRVYMSIKALHNALYLFIGTPRMHFRV